MGFYLNKSNHQEAKCPTIANMKAVLLMLFCVLPHIAYCSRNGFLRQVVTGCLCYPGFTGKYCRAELIDNNENYLMRDSNKYCNHGRPVLTDQCVCDPGFTGEKCEIPLDTEDNEATEDSEDTEKDIEAYIEEVTEETTEEGEHFDVVK